MSTGGQHTRQKQAVGCWGPKQEVRTSDSTEDSLPDGGSRGASTHQSATPREITELGLRGLGLSSSSFRTLPQSKGIKKGKFYKNQNPLSASLEQSQNCLSL